jgi:2-polyprenyl-3-methyl-5-hydroxy-6-metoxy-1,4-benzoquinol methylase
MTVENQRADPFADVRTWRNTFQGKGWWHSFELPDGSRIDGLNDLAALKKRIAQFPIPEDLSGKRVLDIGAWDGWFSFEMERRGAEVMAIDNWDNPRFHQVHRRLHSRVDYRQMDMYDMTPERIGRFDIVLFMGVLYHLKHPLLALERVCALTTGMAAVDSFIVREKHVPGVDVSTVPIMAFYETDELAGQTDNWVGPSLPCLLAFCRTAGFARVELESVIDYSACIACYRNWEAPAHEAPAGPELADVFDSTNGSINFESARDTYLTIFLDSPEQLSRDDVKPEVGGYGVRPLNVWQFGEQRWQVEFKLPPGLTPGWHDVRVRIRDSRPSNALRVAVDLPLEPGPIRMAGVRDGMTWTPNQIDLSQGPTLSVWIEGLPANADRNNLRVSLGSARLEVMYLQPARPNEPRQANAIVPEETETGAANLVVTIGDQRTEPVEVRILNAGKNGVAGSQSSYDAIAGEYAKRIYGELEQKPFDRQLLDEFADRVRQLGPVCDLGCGPGHVARYLRDRGVNAFGLDLSAGMLAEAKRLNAGFEFVRGDMLALGIRPGSLAGIAAFYSIIHFDRDRVPAVLAGLHRALRPGGHLLLSFHLGTDMIHATDFHGHAVDLRVMLFTLAEMTGYIEAAGFSIRQALEREPYPEIEYQSRRGYILAESR